MRISLSLFLLIGIAHAQDEWREPFTGVRYLKRMGVNNAGGAYTAHGVIVDLCAAGIGVRHTAFDERRRTASSFAALTGTQVVINGDWSCRLSMLTYAALQALRRAAVLSHLWHRRAQRRTMAEQLVARRYWHSVSAGCSSTTGTTIRV